MERSVVDRIKEIVTEANEFNTYSQEVFEYCFPEEDSIVVKGVKWIRDKETGKFVLEFQHNKINL